MNDDKILKLALDAGKVMLRNGAETNRVEDTMYRILESFEFSSIDPFVTTTGIFCTIIDKNENIHTMSKRIITRTINLEKVSLINEMSRKLTEGKIDIEEAIELVVQINDMEPYKNSYKIISSAVCCAAFSYIFGGNYKDAFSAFIAGFFLYVFIVKAGKGKLSGFIINILGGSLVSFIVLALFKMNICSNMDVAIIGSIMPLVPGVGLTNAIRDIFVGDYLSGTSRILDAVLVAVCIATGVGVALSFWFYINS